MDVTQGKTSFPEIFEPCQYSRSPQVTGSKFHLENQKILGCALQKWSHNGELYPEFVYLRYNGSICIQSSPKTHKHILLRIFYADIIPPIAGYSRCGGSGACLADKNKLKKDSLVPSCLILL
jgi:hypothetical protein